MKFAQRRMATQTKVIFGDDKLQYSLKDNSTEYEFRVRYVELPFEKTRFTEANTWFRNVGILWSIIGGVSSGSSALGGGSIFAGALWIVLGGACIVAFYLLKTRYTIFQVQQGRIFVIEDSSHAAIVAEIEKRRNAAYLETYGEFNPENDPERERAKFKWLEERGVITAEELQEKLQAIPVPGVALIEKTDKTVH